jgi:hypothetical protein
MPNVEEVKVESHTEREAVSGVMTLYPYYKDRLRGPRLVTVDYGRIGS